MLAAAGAGSNPMDRTAKPSRRKYPEFDAELDDWTPIVSTGAFEPTRTEIRLAGKVFGDRLGRYPNGRSICTSAVRTARSRIVEGAIVQTCNTRYRLLNRSKRDIILLDELQ